MTDHPVTKEENELAEGKVDFGIILSGARRAQNYSIDEISEFLKIPAQTIKALETNNIQQLPPPTFTQGYIRAYAKFLEISENTVLERYNKAVPHNLATDLKPRSNLPGEANSQSPIVKAITLLLILAGVAAVIFGGFQYYLEKAGDIESTLDAETQRFTGNSLNSPGEQIIDEVDAEQTIVETAIEGSDIAVSMTDTQAQDGSGIDQAVDASVTEEVAVNTDANDVDDTIEFYAENGSWIEVRDANNSRLFYNMLAPGKGKALSGAAPFRVTMGNAKTTRVLLNDIDVDVSNYIRPNNTAVFSVSIKDNNIIFY
ncbi:MAG: DUF4115 domain-containing protein [Gammaproteobacteria bacterium]|nr:DUF4115 domain-containing protein [Gammaproteobacteria bacterium]